MLKGYMLLVCGPSAKQGCQLSQEFFEAGINSSVKPNPVLREGKNSILKFSFVMYIVIMGFFPSINLENLRMTYKSFSVCRITCFENQQI